ncbi:MAG: alpha/beta fold hydrolase, partial [Candidatus Eiseniibacteriota bacterium]
GRLFPSAMHVAIRLPSGWERKVEPAWLAGWRSQPFDLGDGTTEVVAVGDGPPLLLLPPLPGYKEAWVAVAWRLARRFRVVTFDLRARFPGPPSWETLLADLERVAAAWTSGATVVVGHSLGGALAQRWAVARPERVAALVLSSSFPRVGSTRGQWRKRYVEQALVLASQRWLPEALAAPLALRLAARGAWVYDPGCDERILAFVRHGIRSVPLGLARQRVRLAFAHDARTELPRIAVPTLLIVGEREARWAREATIEMARLIPHAEVRVSPGVGHLHTLTAAEWLAETIGGWLNR